MGTDTQVPIRRLPGELSGLLKEAGRHSASEVEQLDRQIRRVGSYFGSMKLASRLGMPQSTFQDVRSARTCTITRKRSGKLQRVAACLSGSFAVSHGSSLGPWRCVVGQRLSTRKVVSLAGGPTEIQALAFLAQGLSWQPCLQGKEKTIGSFLDFSNFEDPVWQMVEEAGKRIPETRRCQRRSTSFQVEVGSRREY